MAGTRGTIKPEPWQYLRPYDPGHSGLEPFSQHATGRGKSRDNIVMEVSKWLAILPALRLASVALSCWFA